MRTVSAQAPSRSHRRWTVLAVACIAQLIVVLDATVVTLALPSAQQALGFDDASRQWIVSGYALAFGSLLLLGGRLGERVGYRRAFLVGMTGFALASALGGAAASFAMLVLARVLQGVFAALLAPAALSLLTTTFPDGPERGRAFGIYGALASAGGGIGLLLGGVLTEQLSWRWCLYVNVVLAAVAVAMAVAVRQPDRSAPRVSVDVPGALLVTAGLFAVVLGLGSAESSGWGSTLAWGPLVLGAALLVAFVRVQRHGRHPLLPLSVLADRERLGGYVALLTSSVAIFGLFLFLTYYLQGTLRYSPIMNGLAYLPMILVTTLSSTVLTRRLLGRFGARRVVPVGMLKAATGLLMLVPLGPDSSYLEVLPALLVFGLGIGAIVAPAVDLGTSRVEGVGAGAASALVNTLQQVGGSIGIAVLSTVAASVTAGSAAAGRDAAVLAGYSATYLWSAVVVAVGAVVVALLLRTGRPRRTEPPCGRIGRWMTSAVDDQNARPSGRLAWFQCTAGASGDMMLGALVDAGARVETLQRAVDALGVEPVSLSVERVTRHGLAAARVVVSTAATDRTRTWRDIRELVAAADLPDRVRSRALDVFARLARAEAAAHGVAPEEVHFHEVGALDALADVVGTAAALDELGVDDAVGSPVAVGSGTVRAAHGILPVPGPAVVTLLAEAGAPVYSGPAPYEMCTPTGAALLAATCRAWGGLPPMRVVTQGFGAGGRDAAEVPNVLRVVIGEPAAPDPGAPVEALVLQANVDDLDPRLWPGILSRLLAAGADDAWLTPILMKKGRPAHTLSVLVSPAAAAAARRIVLTETSTIGLRQTTVGKHALAREIRTVVVDGHDVRIKVALLDGAVVNAQPEFDDVAAAAARLGRPVKAVLAAANVAAWTAVHG